MPNALTWLMSFLKQHLQSSSPALCNRHRLQSDFRRGAGSSAPRALTDGSPFPSISPDQHHPRQLQHKNPGCWEPRLSKKPRQTARGERNEAFLPLRKQAAVFSSSFFVKLMIFWTILDLEGASGNQ